METLPTVPHLRLSWQFSVDDKRASLLPPGPPPRRSGAIRRRTWTGNITTQPAKDQVNSEPVELDSIPVLYEDPERTRRRSGVLADVPPSPDREGFKEVVVCTFSPESYHAPPDEMDPLFESSMIPQPLAGGRKKAASAPSPLRHTIASSSPQEPPLVVEHPVYDTGTPDVALELRKRLEEILRDWELGSTASPAAVQKNRLTSDSWMIF